MNKFVGSALIVFLAVLSSGCGPASTPFAPTPTFPPPQATETPAPTATPTELPTVTPTLMIEPPAVATEFLSDIVVLTYESFDTAFNPYASRSNWIWDVQTSSIDNGALEFRGVSTWAGEFSLKRQLGNGQGIIMEFKLEFANGDSEILFRAGDPGTDGYRQFGVWPNRRPAVDLWQRDYIEIPGNKLNGNLTLKPDTPYGLLMAIGEDGERLAVVWDLAAESDRVIYHETLGEGWTGRNWYFGGRADGTETLYIDSIYTISYRGIK